MVGRAEKITVALQSVCRTWIRANILRLAGILIATASAFGVVT
jgi:hypothetical protein